MVILIVYLFVVNVIGFFMMGYDKSQAKRRGQRIPEKRLFTFAAVGGALGTWAAMRVHRHKTKHMKFVIGIPLLFVLNVFCSYYLFKFVS
ncbi:DUF1294 domain-containing protein [Paenibacillus sp. UNC451MF]|uniref:DUF1294 domain-containing protein n=1 Tax=Paenibacillus sp. UNC451MF TaxID=1449063 RepID=UPI00048C2B1A|nr:DUF1294 domain-containing protein [Paenibacillus sp. UNC451MF]